MTTKIAHGIKALLKFNDVYSLSLAQYEITDYLIDEILILETDDVKKMQNTLMSIIVGSKALSLTNFWDNRAEALTKVLKNQLQKIMESV